MDAGHIPVLLKCRMLIRCGSGSSSRQAFSGSFRDTASGSSNRCVIPADSINRASGSCGISRFVLRNCCRQ